MIAVDTNILARYDVDDPADREAARQRPIAERLMREGAGVLVTVTAVLEFAWMARAGLGNAPLRLRTVPHACAPARAGMQAAWKRPLRPESAHGTLLDAPGAQAVARVFIPSRLLFSATGGRRRTWSPPPAPSTSGSGLPG